MQAQISFPTDRSQPVAQGDIEQAAQLFRVHGTLLLEHSHDAALVESLRQDFLQNYASRDRASIESTCLKVGDERYMFTIALQGAWLDPSLYAAPRVLPIVKSLLGPDCVIQSYGVVCAFPGAGVQHVHRDHPHLFAEAGGLNAFLPPYALHVVIPLANLDTDTGTTALWEGSHRIRSRAEETRWSREELERLQGAVLPWPKMGDCYFMDFRLRHAGTANRSSQPRPILYIVYSRRWFQDRKNYETGIQAPLALGRKALENVPAEHRHLFENARIQNDP